MTATLGTASLLLALTLAIAGIAAPFVLRRRPVAVGAAMRAGQIALVTLAGGLLVYALITGNFSLEYVAHNSSLRTPLYHRITGLWAALEGSLLLWEWMLVVFAGVVAWQHRGRQAELMPWVEALQRPADAVQVWQRLLTLRLAEDNRTHVKALVAQAQARITKPALAGRPR